jgi:hypothetical protein
MLHRGQLLHQTHFDCSDGVRAIIIRGRDEHGTLKRSPIIVIGRSMLLPRQQQDDNSAVILKMKPQADRAGATSDVLEVSHSAGNHPCLRSIHQARQCGRDPYDARWRRGC